MTHALHTDLYQLTMLASYFHQGMHETPAICEMFVRRLPKNRRFLVAAGLEQALAYLQNVRFTDAQIESLKEIPGLRRAMTHDFIEYLRRFRFTGDVHAVPEGTVVFQNEPLVRVEAPLGEAQLIETFLLSTINHQSMVASKAARIVIAADGRPVLEFGTRRTHAHAAVDVARASYIAGFAGTSNVEAFYRYDVPARGTMAHMYIMASENEEEAFRHYSELYGASTYLVDTYDTLRGTALALDVVGKGVESVRIDSGDLGEMSKSVRALLDEKGRQDVRVVASSDLDEYELERLATEGAIDAAGVGTRIATSDDAPSLGGVYKLVQIGERAVAKLSESKVTYPGPHQIYRYLKDGKLDHDALGLAHERSYEFVDAEKLLVPVVKQGAIVYQEPIHDMRARCVRQLAQLPDDLRVIGPRTDTYDSHYEVRPSDQLNALLDQCRTEMEAT